MRTSRPRDSCQSGRLRVQMWMIISVSRLEHSLNCHLQLNAQVVILSYCQLQCISIVTREPGWHKSQLLHRDLQRCTDKALASYQSADNRHLTIGRLPINKKTYFAVLSYLFRLQLLSEDSYLLEGLQTADETKRIQNQSYKTHPLLPETEATLMFQQMTYIDAYINFISVTCSPHKAKTRLCWVSVSWRMTFSCELSGCDCATCDECSSSSQCC